MLCNISKLTIKICKAYYIVSRKGGDGSAIRRRRAIMDIKVLLGAGTEDLGSGWPYPTFAFFLFLILILLVVIMD